MFNLQEILLDINSNAIQAIDAINKSKAYIALIVDKEMSLVGTITDGDIRRGVEQNGNNIFDKTAKDFMSANPKVISSDTLAITALELMEEYSITSLFVYSSENLKKPDGVIHIHDILKAGIK